MIPVTVTFYGDVGFDRSYNHVIDFASDTQRETYFTPKILKTVENCAYNKPLNTIQLKCNYEEALKFTYCKFVIGSNTSHKKKIFAWVDDVVLVTDQKDESNTFVPILSITIAVDPWQTFLFDFTVGESFVAREHVDRFKANGDGTVGWTLPNQIDKSSIGVTKRVRTLKNDFRQNHTLVDINNNVVTAKIRWFCIQFVYKDETDTLGKNMMLNLLIPCSDTVRFAFISHFTYGGVSKYYGAISMLTSEILDGSFITYFQLDPERIASVTYIPFDIADFTIDNAPTQEHGIVYDLYGEFTRYNKLVTNDNFEATSRPIKWLGESVFTQPLMCFTIEPKFMAGGFPNDIKFSYSLTDVRWVKPSNNAVYDTKYEPQLYKDPFKKITIIDEFNIEKGEFDDIFTNIYNSSYVLNFDIYLLFDSVDMRIRIVPNGLDVDSKYWIEYSLSKVEVLRNAWLSYMLQERDATRQMITLQNNQQLLNSALGGVSSALSMGGNAGLNNSISNMKTDDDAVKLSSSSVGAAYGGVGLGVGAISAVGGYAINSHYAFEQQDARERAIKNKANNISQQGVFKSVLGEFRIVETNSDVVTFDIKAKEYHKYGYPVYKYETPNLKSRKFFNYIASNLVKIEGSLNNNIKMALMTIFNNGVTIWHGDYISELSGIGDYSKENIERSLL